MLIVAVVCLKKVWLEPELKQKEKGKVDDAKKVQVREGDKPNICMCSRIGFVWLWQGEPDTGR